MKILMISQMLPYLPCYDGFRIIPAHLMRCLSERNEIDLLAFSDGRESEVQLEWPRQYCNSVELLKTRSKGGMVEKLKRFENPFPPEIVEVVQAQVDKVSPDAIHLEGPVMAPFAELLRTEATTLLSAHDSLYLRYQDFSRNAGSIRERSKLTARAMLLKRFEKRWYKSADRIVVTSELDRKTLKSFIPTGSIHAIANGVDFDTLAFRPEPVEGRIVFTGNMTFPPNVDAALRFARDIFPVVRKGFPNAEFWVVGADPVEKVLALKELDGVNVTGTVPDIREEIWNAAIYASPLRFGAGCKNKILEAMALGAPIVATSQSLTGTPLEDGRHVLIADDDALMVASVLKLLLDDALRGALSAEARRFVEANYSWESAAARFESLYSVHSEKAALSSVGAAG